MKTYGLNQLRRVLVQEEISCVNTIQVKLLLGWCIILLVEKVNMIKCFIFVCFRTLDMQGKVNDNYIGAFDAGKRIV